MPVQKQAGDRVIGATVNNTGSLIMQAERVGADTLLARIVQMVAEAQRSRAPIQEARRYRLGLLRSRRGARRSRHVHRLGDGRSRAGNGLRDD